MITRFIWTIWTSLSAVPRKAVKFSHPPTNSRSNKEFAISQPKMIRLPRNEKQTYRLTIGFDLGHDLDLEFSRSNVEFTIALPKMVRLPRNEKQTYRLNPRPQMWPMGLTLAMTLTFEFSRSNVTLTIWWPRSGVRIYQIVTGVTSDVGVPSTRLIVVVVVVVVIVIIIIIIESSRYTGGDFMFLHRFVRRRRRHHRRRRQPQKNCRYRYHYHNY